ncbi:MAG TPA: hypothetical protein VK142_05140 [Bacillota bacterium]|nr:hypothetical protein [Bacillota bacterium]
MPKTRSIAGHSDEGDIKEGSRSGTPALFYGIRIAVQRINF